MRRHWAVRMVRFAVFAAVFLAVAGFVVKGLWNWLMPGLFGWHAISYWQALGILVLSKILFGGFRGGGPGRHWYWRRRMMERWEKMTPEEREKFRQGMRARCSPFREPETGAKPTAG
ncbi:MAG: hypothetical protein ACXVZR_09305 [Terriglobales bacterium]